MSREVVLFQEAHRAGLVSALGLVRADGNLYPPNEDCGNSPSELGAWLFGEATERRWVCLEGKEVLGHVSVTQLHEYLRSRLASEQPTLEVGKLFVRPDARGSGCGRDLLSQALRWIAGMNALAALAVLPTSEAAVALYRDAGLREIGEFQGVHGRNLVFVSDAGRIAFSKVPR